MPTVYTPASRPTNTSYTGRPSLEGTNTISPIITGVWNDLNTWLETGKFWNDAGGGTGTVYTGRIIP